MTLPGSDWADVMADAMFYRMRFASNPPGVIAATLRRMCKPASEQYGNPEILEAIFKEEIPWR